MRWVRKIVKTAERRTAWASGVRLPVRPRTFKRTIMKRTNKNEFRRVQNARMQQMLMYCYFLSEFKDYSKERIDDRMRSAMRIYDRCERTGRIMSDEDFAMRAGFYSDQHWAQCKDIKR